MRWQYLEANVDLMSSRCFFPKRNRHSNRGKSSLIRFENPYNSICNPAALVSAQATFLFKLRYILIASGF